MKFGWPRKRQPDPVQREVEEQAERSKATLERVEKVLDKAVEIIEDYNVADRARLARDS